MGISKEELAAMEAADREIEETFRMTQEDFLASGERDRAARFDQMDQKTQQTRLRERAYYQAHAEERRAYRRKRSREHPEREAAWNRAWREANKEHIAAYGKAYRESHKEQIQAKNKAYGPGWYQRNKERVAAYNKAYREKNRANLEVTPVEVRLDELSPRWISTKESLPESNDRVLVRAVLSIFVVAVWDNEEGVWRATWDYNVIEPEYVTHWMPLPEPPGEEDDTQ